jgi:hypothetical protein
MSSNRNVYSMVCGLCLTVLACNGTTREPTAPRRSAPSEITNSLLSGFSAIEEGVDEAPSAFATATLSPTGGIASGHADIFATPKQNVVEQTYSFTAVSAGALPAARGEFEGHGLRFTGETVNIHADVTCMTIVGSQAWIGARITRATVDGEEVAGAAGTPLTFSVFDGGETAAVADSASLWFVASPSDIGFCNTRPTGNRYRASAIGNIQVRSK